MWKNKYFTAIQTYLPVFLFILITSYTIVVRLINGNPFTIEYQVHAVLLSFVVISFMFKYPATLFTTLVAIIIGLFFPSVFTVGNHTYFLSISVGMININILYLILLLLFIVCNYKLIPALIQWAFNSNSAENN